MLPQKRIYIIGSVGSGKTTLARRIAAKTGITAYELDNVVWERHPDGDRRRASAERDCVLQGILQENSWIVEGAHHDTWVLPIMQQADQIIFLNLPNRIILYRIMKRFIRQKTGIEKANYRPTFHIFRRMFQWNAQFQTKGIPQVLHNLDPFRDKTVILRTDKDLKEVVSVLF
ncbi:DNA topology modulation protein FlaR [Sporolactobacillus nakayamae]|uniref:Adenylate kinase n=1 Tax=Sporolactobacillus nakayamae TaxID=269670 RepID=A0A1I2S778_9BACL|nr:DNA topology modulation protein FlaR [Sporolactobacillus nakayamae]SFG48620.1 hypothetical protein SAMN02982927_01861 [Sporolactobacillus nakayamae]